jgi:hypothetical protein
MTLSDIQRDIDFVSDYKVYTSCEDGYDLHDQEGNYLGSFEEAQDLIHWVENN